VDTAVDGGAAVPPPQAHNDMQVKRKALADFRIIDQLHSAHLVDQALGWSGLRKNTRLPIINRTLCIR
jgi:hypothetical protein